MFRWFARRDRGFTMIEMMVVLIIIAVLIGVGIKFYTGYIENARVTKAKTQISTMQAGLDAYYAENNSYPVDDAGLLNAGIQPDTNDTNWSDGKTINSTDPWGKKYLYRVDANNKVYKVYTGYDKVQGQTNMSVVGVGQDGASQPPSVAATPTTP